MDFGEIMTYAATALGGGGIAGLLNWRWNKRKAAAETKQDEIEVIRKTIEEVYKPTIEYQNQQIRELRETITLQQGEIAELRRKVDECADSRDECHEALSAIRSQVEGLAEGRPSRDNKTGRYAPRRKRDEAGS
jgi:septal ring factor EnvC (AmiA/AmiB activator)